jgi:hypothetical protein
MDNEQLKETFGPYRKPTELTIPKYKTIQEWSMNMAAVINSLCPESREKAIALTKLQEARMFANAAIAIYTKESNDTGSSQNSDSTSV